MKTETGGFSFKVPETHVLAGKKIEEVFEYQVCENDTDAQEILDAKEWTLIGLVNDNLKANARSNAYQNASAVYRPLNESVTPEKIKERMIRDYIRLGISEDVARKQVDALLGVTA
jgi:hypothetical protein